MAIEPLSSVMTYQAQNTNVTKTVPATAVTEGMDATAQENGAKFDQTTLGVAQTEQASTDGSGGGNASGQSMLQQEKKAQQETTEQIKKAVEQFNKNANSEAVFGIHDETNRVTIKIVDKSSKKVIKELPPEKTLDMIAKVWEMAGILIDEKR